MSRASFSEQWTRRGCASALLWCLEPSTLVLTYDPSSSFGADATPISELGPRDSLKFTMARPILRTPRRVTWKLRCATLSFWQAE